MKVGVVKVHCMTCQKIFTKHACHIKQHPKNFCCRSCYWKHLVGHKQSEATRNKRSLKLSGENSPTWRGGHSRQYKRGYKSEHFKRWRISVFERDQYTCRSCGVCGSQAYLTAHHIKSFARFPDLRYDIANGMTLCEKCHSQTDNYKSKARA